MKANELMHGDWIRRRWIAKPSGTEVVKDFQVDQLCRLHTTDEVLYVYSKNGNMGRVDQMEPIPLTEKILEKNGFIYHKRDGSFGLPTTISYGNWDVDVALFNVTNEYINNQLHISTPDDSITLLHLMECNQVHQLQHALRLCGIDKEIEL